ncbi:hypothetical protein DYL72_15755 [Vibrio anguillarum]|uniref:Uncharacterized protein n=1 Tax=Vibrio anguillarum TaxID=55601 RepID=A0A7U6J4R3_VIBAN|nr:hypothetical protein [Vibrio anguillarum]AZS26359.1 hypothetical protein DYL72_15755 [Vibrio anguillarum]
MSCFDVSRNAIETSLVEGKENGKITIEDVEVRLNQEHLVQIDLDGSVTKLSFESAEELHQNLGRSIELAKKFNRENGIKIVTDESHTK